MSVGSRESSSARSAGRPPPSTGPTSQLDLIHVSNFKNFAGCQTFGPFAEYKVTGIFGENGSGKSNLFDAVCFVLDAKKAMLRAGSDLRNLKSRHKIPEVLLNYGFTNGNEEVFAAALDVRASDGRTVQLCRSYHEASNKSHFYVNEQNVRKDEYLHVVASLGLSSTIMKDFVIRDKEIDRIIAVKEESRFTEFLNLAGCTDLYKAWKDGLARSTSLTSSIERLRKERKNITAEIQRNMSKYDLLRRAKSVRENLVELEVDRALVHLLFAEGEIEEVEGKLTSTKDKLEDVIHDLTTRAGDNLDAVRKKAQEEVQGLWSRQIMEKEKLINMRMDLSKARVGFNEYEVKQKEHERGKEIIRRKLCQVNETEKCIHEEMQFLQQGHTNVSQEVAASETSIRGILTSQTPQQPLPDLTPDQRAKFDALTKEVERAWDGEWPAITEAIKSYGQAKIVAYEKTDSLEKCEDSLRSMMLTRDDGKLEDMKRKLQHLTDDVLPDQQENWNREKERCESYVKSVAVVEQRIREIEARRAQLSQNLDELKRKNTVKSALAKALEDKKKSGDVLGRFQDLIKYNGDPKFKKAVIRKVFSKRNDIIVRNTRAAIEFIKSVAGDGRHAKSGPWVSTIILDDLRDVPMMRNQQSLPNGVHRMASMLARNDAVLGNRPILTDDNELQKLINVFVGDAVVVEGDEEGLRFWRSLPENRKLEVITMEGTVIKKGGGLRAGSRTLGDVESQVFGDIDPNVVKDLNMTELHLEKFMARLEEETKLRDKALEDYKERNIELEKTKKEIEELTKAIAEAETSSETAKKKVENTKREIQGKRKEVEEAEKVLYEKKEVLIQRKNRLKEIEVRIMQPLAAEVGLSDWSAHTVAGRLGVSDLKLTDEMKAKFQAKKSELGSYEKRIDRRRADLEKLRTSKEQLVKAMQEKERIIASLDPGNLREKVAELARAVDRQKEVVDKLEEEIAEARVKLNNLNTDITAKKQEERMLRKKVEELESHRVRLQRSREATIKGIVKMGLPVPLIAGRLYHTRRSNQSTPAHLSSSNASPATFSNGAPEPMDTSDENRAVSGDGSPPAQADGSSSTPSPPQPAAGSPNSPDGNDVVMDDADDVSNPGSANVDGDDLRRSRRLLEQSETSRDGAQSGISGNTSTFEFRSLRDFKECMDLLEKEKNLMFDYSSLEKRYGITLPAMKDWSNRRREEVLSDLCDLIKQANEDLDEFRSEEAERSSFLDSDMSRDIETLGDQDIAQGKVDRIDEKLKDKKKELKELSTSRGTVLEELKEKFLYFMNMVNSVLEPTFQKLSGRPGSIARLVFPDGADPFSDDAKRASVKYHVHFAGKRYTSFGSLSGGEKALAALALFFAIHRARKAPILLLDEVDRNLDASGQYWLKCYLTEMSKDCQIFIISHRDSVLCCAEQLLFPSKRLCPGVSRWLVQDLRMYPHYLADTSGSVGDSPRTEMDITLPPPPPSPQHSRDSSVAPGGSGASTPRRGRGRPRGSRRGLHSDRGSDRGSSSGQSGGDGRGAGATRGRPRGRPRLSTTAAGRGRGSQRPRQTEEEFFGTPPGQSVEGDMDVDVPATPPAAARRGAPPAPASCSEWVERHFSSSHQGSVAGSGRVTPLESPRTDRSGANDDDEGMPAGRNVQDSASEGSERPEAPSESASANMEEVERRSKTTTPKTVSERSSEGGTDAVSERMSRDGSSAEEDDKDEDKTLVNEDDDDQQQEGSDEHTETEEGGGNITEKTVDTSYTSYETDGSSSSQEGRVVKNRGQEGEEEVAEESHDEGEEEEQGDRGEAGRASRSGSSADASKSRSDASGVTVDRPLDSSSSDGAAEPEAAEDDEENVNDGRERSASEANRSSSNNSSYHSATMSF